MQPPPYISSTSTGSLAGLMVPQRHSVVIMLLLYCVMATLAAAVHATAWFTWFTAQPGRAASSRAVAKQVVRS